MRSPIAASALFVLSCLFLGGCSSEESASPSGKGGAGAGGSAGRGGSAGSGGTSGAAAGTGGGAGDAGTVRLLGSDCDPIVPTQCGYPFPSNVYLVDNPNTKTGKQVKFGATTLPKAANGTQTQPGVFEWSDGFSAGATLLTHVPGATVTGLANPDTISKSLEPASPTVLIEAETGTRVPHFSELDMSTDQADGRAFMIRPVVRLKDATRYIVAIRNVVDAGGTPIPATPVFAAIRDGTPHSDPSVALRKALYDDTFSKLGNAGVERQTLQIAWDFTTASRENNTQWLVSMRDEALAQVGADGPEYVIDRVQTDPNADLAVRIEARMLVPLYLDQPGAGASLSLGPNGMPKQNGTAEYPFLVLIPKSATTGTPGALFQIGHGLLGSRTEADSYASRANQKNYVVFAFDWIGMARDDVTFITGVINGGDMSRFKSVPDRQHQGILNFLLGMRMMSGRFARDPAVQFAGKSAIDTTQRYYLGGSQGGIFGASYMALSTDVVRGGLGVPGQPYSLLLNRSVDFDPFFTIMRNALPRPLDLQLSLGLSQMLWDRVEPNGYSAYISQNMLPATPKHDVLMMIAIGDHQVSPLGAHIMARAIGAKHIKPVNRSIFGLEEVDAPYVGSAMLEFDFGNPVVPITNVPPRDGSQDPHGRIKGLQPAADQMDQFLRTGNIAWFCTGPCDPT